MIPTIPLEILVSGWIGLMLAWATRRKLLGGSRLWSGEFVAVLSLGATVLWPVLLYFLVVHPDWSWLYLRADPGRPSPVLIVGALVVVMGALAGGWIGGRALVLRQKEKILVGLLAGLLGVAALVITLLRRRLGRSGTYEEFHAGRALPLVEGKLGWVLIVAALGIAVAVLIVARALRGPAAEETEEREGSAARSESGTRDVAGPSSPPSTEPTVSGPSVE